MVIAALVSFGILLIAWIVAPERNTDRPPSDPRLDLVGIPLGDAQLVGADRLALGRN